MIRPDQSVTYRTTLAKGQHPFAVILSTVEATEKKSAPAGNDIDVIVAAIKPAVEKAETDKASDMVDASVRNNIANVVASLGTKAILGAAVAAGSLHIVGARYDLDAGSVEFLA